MTWICPSCGQPLQLDEKTYRCINKHTFDVAKEGYVNLLLAQHKNSKQPGDNKQMVNARNTFLQKQYYSPLADKMGELLVAHLPQGTTEILDVGCGEGYYLNRCQLALQKAGYELSAKGFDISKFAVQKAAKSNKQADFAVASSYSIPLAAASQDAVIQVFAPSAAAEIARLLKPAGIWLVVAPAAQHLHQLKTLLYETPQTHKENDEIGLVTLVAKHSLRFDIQISAQEDRAALLMMTPYYWSSSQQARQKVETSLNQVTADFQINVYQRAD